MNYPAALHLPGILGTVLGSILCMQYWGTNKPLAILLLVVLMGGGIFLGLRLSDKFFKGLGKK